jgi:NIPSNAP
MWGYEDLVDRAKRSTALTADPEWLRFLDKIQPLSYTWKRRFSYRQRFHQLHEACKHERL